MDTETRRILDPTRNEVEIKIYIKRKKMSRGNKKNLKKID